MNHLKAELPWIEIHDILLHAGSFRTPKELFKRFVKGVYRILPYDRAIAFFVNDSGAVNDIETLGVDRQWIEDYLRYYSKLENGRYALVFDHRYARTRKSVSNRTFDWGNSKGDEFIAEYIKPQGLHHSLGVVFHDPGNMIKTIISFDRTKQSGFSQREIMIVEVLQAHLDNLYKNLLAEPAQCSGPVRKTDQPLTKREQEIVHLLCNGLTPAAISQKLYLSTSTVYKHISNTYAKLHISNRQELILMMLNQ